MKVAIGYTGFVQRGNAGWVAAGLALAVSACGSGGGTPLIGTLGSSGASGASSSGSNVGTNASSTNTTAIQIGFTGTAAEPQKSGNALFIYMPNYNQYAVTARSPASGTPVSINQSFSASGSPNPTASVAVNSVFDNATVTGSGIMNYNTGVYINNSANHAFSMTAGTNGTLQDATWGLIYFTKGTAFGDGGYHAGNPTPVMQLPVSANYSGSFTGRAYMIGKSSADGWYGIPGTVSLAANFTNSTISGTVGLYQNNAAPYDIALNGTITGNKYSGTATTVAQNGTTAVPTPTSSAWNGAFYGTNATQTAGALRIEGMVPNSTGGLTNTAIVGAYGAVKQ